MSPIKKTLSIRRTLGESITVSSNWHFSKPSQVSLPVPSHSDRNGLGINHSLEQRMEDNKVNKLGNLIKHLLVILALHHK
jgi:hypothetical protein